MIMFINAPSGCEASLSGLIHMVKCPFLCLKGLAQAKIIKKSVILFRVLNMTI